jgi:hypothetical protein
MTSTDLDPNSDEAALLPPVLEGTSINGCERFLKRTNSIRTSVSLVINAGPPHGAIPVRQDGAVTPSSAQLTFVVLRAGLVAMVPWPALMAHQVVG